MVGVDTPNYKGGIWPNQTKSCIYVLGLLSFTPLLRNVAATMGQALLSVNAELFERSTFVLPIYPELSGVEKGHIVKSVKKIAGRYLR